MFKKLFVPSDDSDLTSMALLVARLWFGLTMLFNHGLYKLAHFNDIVAGADATVKFQDPLGLGLEASLVLVVMAEVGAALLLAMGFMTRVAASILLIDMFVAFLMVHKAGMSGGELAFVYLAGYFILVIAGGGLFSLDTVMFSKSDRSRIQKNENEG